MPTSSAMVPTERVGAIATDFNWQPTSAEPKTSLRKIMRTSVTGDRPGKQRVTDTHTIAAFDSQLPKVRHLPRIKSKKSRGGSAQALAPVRTSPRGGLSSAGGRVSPSQQGRDALALRRPQSPSSPSIRAMSADSAYREGGGPPRTAPLQPAVRRDFYLPERLQFLDFLQKHRISKFGHEFEHWFFNDEVLTRIVLSNPETNELVVRNGRQHLSEAAVANLGNLSKLEVLDIPDCRGFTRESVNSIIRRVPSLMRLNLTNCELVDDEVLSVLALKARQLQFLSVAQCHRITDMGFKTLGERPTTFKPLLELDVGRCKGLTDKGLLALLRGTRNLVKLSLAGLTNLTDLGMMGFTSAAGNGTNPALVSLDLSGTLVDASGFAWIAPGVPVLRDLNLADCERVGSQVLELLGEHVHGLVTLNLSNCAAISDGGIAALGPQPDLDKLVLSNCSELTDAAFEALALNAPRLRCVCKLQRLHNKRGYFRCDCC